MRTKKFPGLDACDTEYLDLFGTHDDSPREIERLIGEGVVELPAECRDPLDIVIEAEAQQEEREFNEFLADLLARFPRRVGRVLVWHAWGYEPHSQAKAQRQREDLLAERDPLAARMQQSRILALQERGDLETLRALYSR